jgi:hypothetical protein
MLHDALAPLALMTAPISSRAWTVYNRCPQNKDWILFEAGVREGAAGVPFFSSVKIKEG